MPMTLKELREALKGSDELPVVVVTPEGSYELYSVEEGVAHDSDGHPEFWLVTGDDPV